MEKMSIGLLVTFFIGVIVAISLLGPIAKETQYMTEKFDISAEGHAHDNAWSGGVFDITYQLNTTNTYPSGDWRISDCPMTGVSLTMANGTALAATTDYVFSDTTGTYTLEDSALINQTATDAAGGNYTNVTYTFCSEGYITDAGGRAIANLILILAAIGLLAFAVWHVIGKIE